jgi:hypothetical protein
MNKKKAKILIIGNTNKIQETQLQANPPSFNLTPRKTISLAATITWYHINYQDTRN